jgi:probable HAF family extracellular repeat protein
MFFVAKDGSRGDATDGSRTGRRVIAAIAGAVVLIAVAVLTSAPTGAAKEPAKPLEALSRSTMLGLDLGPSVARPRLASGTSSRTPSPVFVLDKGRFTAIDPPGKRTPNHGAAINNRGEIVGGYISSSGLGRGFLRDKRGRFSPIDVPGAEETEPHDINDPGEIVGNYTEHIDPAAGNPLRGFLRDQGGGFTRIDFPGAAHTQAFGVNDGGQVVGQYDDADGGLHGYLWEEGRFTTIDGPAGAVGVTATDINDDGQIVGGYLDSAGRVHGFLLSEGVYTSFDSPGATSTVPFGINDRGQITGFAGDRGEITLVNNRSFVLRQGATGPFTYIKVPNTPLTVATKINNAGTVSGTFARNPLSVQPRRQTVKQGESAAFTATISNPGGPVPVRGVKVCVKAPPEAIRVKGCVNVGELPAGDTDLEFEATARRNARPRSYILRFEGSASGFDPFTATATLNVRGKR